MFDSVQVFSGYRSLISLKYEGLVFILETDKTESVESAFNRARHRIIQDRTAFGAGAVLLPPFMEFILNHVYGLTIHLDTFINSILIGSYYVPTYPPRVDFV